MLVFSTDIMHNTVMLVRIGVPIAFYKTNTINKIRAPGGRVTAQRVLLETRGVFFVCAINTLRLMKWVFLVQNL